VVVVVVGTGASSGFGGLGGFGFACFSGFASPCRACEGGTAGVAGVAGLGFGGFADVAGIAGVARSWVSESCGGLAEVGGGEAAASGALVAGGVDGGLPDELVPLEGGGAGAAVPGVVGVVGGVPGDGEGVGEGVDVPPPDGGDGAGPCTLEGAGAFDTRIGVKPGMSGGATRRVTACGVAVGETRTGTLRTCVLGTASSRVNDRSLTVKACSQSWADATAPAATAPT
jgi:hypothetical protein